MRTHDTSRRWRGLPFPCHLEEGVLDILRGESAIGRADGLRVCPCLACVQVCDVSVSPVVAAAGSHKAVPLDVVATQALPNEGIEDERARGSRGCRADNPHPLRVKGGPDAGDATVQVVRRCDFACGDEPPGFDQRIVVRSPACNALSVLRGPRPLVVPEPHAIVRTNSLLTASTSGLAQSTRVACAANSLREMVAGIAPNLAMGGYFAHVSGLIATAAWASARCRPVRRTPRV